MEFRDFLHNTKVLDQASDFPPAITDTRILLYWTRGVRWPKNGACDIIHTNLEALGIKEEGLGESVKNEIYYLMKSRSIKLKSLFALDGATFARNMLHTSRDWFFFSQLESVRFLRVNLSEKQLISLGKLLPCSNVVKLSLETMAIHPYTALFGFVSITHFWMNECHLDDPFVFCLNHVFKGRENLHMVTGYGSMNNILEKSSRTALKMLADCHVRLLQFGFLSVGCNTFELAFREFLNVIDGIVNNVLY